MFKIVVSIVRTKLIASLLGPAGMGIAGLLTSTTSLVGGLTNLGLSTSAVKAVASAASQNHPQQVSLIVKTLRILIWVSGIIGMVLVILSSSYLSVLTFGSTEYSISFIWLSVTMLMTQLSNGEIVIIQGLRKIRFLAKASLYGSIIGLIISIPLFYYYRIQSIVPSIIATGFVTMMVSYYFSRQVKIPNTKITFREGLLGAGEMVRLGLYISLSGIFPLAASYFVRAYISQVGGLEQVGFYNAGYALINTYVGLIFTAMGTDYFPRLSAVAHDNRLCRKNINEQAEVSILFLSPILITLVAFIEYIIPLLYSSDFTPINSFVFWASVGMLFKAISWSIGYVFFAKGNGRLLLLSELLSHGYTLPLNLAGYHYYGLSGLGISFSLSYLLHLIQVFIISKKLFMFSFQASLVKIFLIQLCLILGTLFSTRILSYPYSIFFGFGILLASVYYSFLELERKIGLKTIFHDYYNKHVKSH